MYTEIFYCSMTMVMMMMMIDMIILILIAIFIFITLVYYCETFLLHIGSVMV